ncbi:MAG: hypothetical protein CVV61_04215 [Tenericutes bacterium HGW-Tenericutes-6]|nr:MAG: hypothetical protein CVV61_04215 [Tenericutes bacterium HGW-Tenericutes-6]
MKKIYKDNPFLAFSLITLIISSLMLILYLSILDTVFMSYVVLSLYGITLIMYIIHLYHQIKEKLKQ